MDGNTTDRMLSPLFTWRSAVASEESKLTATQRHVALTLSLHMNERGASCYPSIPTQAAETGLAESTVREACRQLAAQGWLVRNVGGGRWATEYTATIPTWYAPPPTPGGVLANSRRAPRRQPVGTPPRTGDQGVIQDDMKDGSPSPLGGNVWTGPQQIGGKKVTKQEASVAQQVLAAFNERSGKRFSGKEWLADIVRRIREHPDVSLARHQEIIDQQFARPWWKDDPTPSVIYGNGKVFDRAVNGNQGPAKRESKYTRPMNLDEVRERIRDGT